MSRRTTTPSWPCGCGCELRNFADNYPHEQIIHTDRPTGAFAVKFATFASQVCKEGKFAKGIARFANLDFDVRS